MPEKRDPPAYQEFAASILAKLHFRKMSLQDRGLLYTMRMECWVNRKLPNEESELALVLGLPVDQVRQSLPHVMPFMERVDNFITCPELDNYRELLAERRRKQSKGGKVGANITNNKRKPKSTIPSNPTSNPTSNPRAPHRGGDGSLVQNSTEKNNQNQSNHEEEKIDPWLQEYSSTENLSSSDCEEF